MITTLIRHLIWAILRICKFISLLFIYFNLCTVCIDLSYKDYLSMLKKGMEGMYVYLVPTNLQKNGHSLTRKQAWNLTIPKFHHFSTLSWKRTISNPKIKKPSTTPFTFLYLLTPPFFPKDSSKTVQNSTMATNPLPPNFGASIGQLV